MLLLFLKLILAHILGDFVFQSKYLVEKRKTNIWYLLLHVFIHFVILCLLFYSDLSKYFVIILFITIAHLAIDSFKIWIEKKYHKISPLLFILDQVLHIGVLIGAVIYMYGLPYSFLSKLNTYEVLMYLIAFLLISVVSPVFLRIVFNKWNTESEFILKKKESLGNAGLLIGIIERLIIVLFIQVGFLSGIGFLLAAKSIFRFGDLANAKDTKFTEYILAGTLMSFLIAIIVGYMLRLGLRLT